MSGNPYNYTKAPLPVSAETSVTVSECGQNLHDYGAYLVWGLSDDDSVVAMQLLPAAVVFILAVLDLQLRKPALSPVREHRECQRPITLILPSLVWRTMNWCTMQRPRVAGAAAAVALEHPELAEAPAVRDGVDAPLRVLLTAHEDHRAVPGPPAPEGPRSPGVVRVKCSEHPAPRVTFGELQETLN